MLFEVLIIVLLILILTFLVFLFKRDSPQPIQNFNSAIPEESPQNGINQISKAEPKKIKIDLREIEVVDLMEGRDILQSMSENKLSELNSLLPEAMNGSIQSVRYLSSKNEYIVEFTKKGQAMLDAGGAKFSKKGNKLFPQLRVNGKYQEHATLASNGKKTLSAVTKLSAIVVSAAHIISGADVAKKLKTIDKKIDLILEDRTNELYAELESILKHSIEATLIDDPNYSKDELRRLSKDIYRFRSRWRLRLEAKLNKIENLHKGKIREYFDFRSKRKDAKMLNELSEFEEELKMIDASLSLQLVLADEREELDLFQKEILPIEIKQLKNTKKLFESKAKFITENFEKDGVSTKELIEPFNQFLEKYEQLSYSSVEIEEIETVEQNLIEK